MPVLRGGMHGAPQWCELEKYELVPLGAAGSHTWRATHPANKIVVAAGRCRVVVDGAVHTLSRGEVLDAPVGEHAITTDDEAVIVPLGGRWGDECGGTGVFTLDESEPRADNGDPVSYPKRTAFDRHYHDCDEYWIVVSGRGTVCTEGIHYDVGPSDCVATRCGHHHDFPLVADPVTAVFFETTLRGRRRLGHLWEHTHGPVRPAADGEE